MVVHFWLEAADSCGRPDTSVLRDRDLGHATHLRIGQAHATPLATTGIRCLETERSVNGCKRPAGLCLCFRFPVACVPFHDISLLLPASRLGRTSIVNNSRGRLTRAVQDPNHALDRLHSPTSPSRIAACPARRLSIQGARPDRAVSPVSQVGKLAEHLERPDDAHPTSVRASCLTFLECGRRTVPRPICPGVPALDGQPGEFVIRVSSGSTGGRPTQAFFVTLVGEGPRLGHEQGTHDSAGGFDGKLVYGAECCEAGWDMGWGFLGRMAYRAVLSSGGFCEVKRQYGPRVLLCVPRGLRFPAIARR